MTEENLIWIELQNPQWYENEYDNEKNDKNITKIFGSGC